MTQNKSANKKPTAKQIAKAAEAIATRRPGKGRKPGRSAQQRSAGGEPKLEPVGAVRDLLLEEPEPSSGPEIVKPYASGPRVRTRTEIRQRCAAVFDGVISDIFAEHLRRLQKEGFISVVDDKGRLHEYPMDSKAVAGVQAIASLYAQVGVGFIGVNQVDPQEIPNLPPPVFKMVDPNAPLPEGAPE